MHVPCIEQKVRKTILQSFVVLCLVLLKILPANAQKFIFQEGVEDINFPVLSADPTTGWLKYWQETNSMFVSQPYSTLMRTDSVSRSGKYSARFQLDRAEYPDNIKRINGGSELIWNDACKTLIMILHGWLYPFTFLNGVMVFPKALLKAWCLMCMIIPSPAEPVHAGLTP